MDEVGVRQLRASLPAIVRRAEHGQTTVITVFGRPVARLAPLGGDESGRGVAELVAAGLLVAPRRAGPPTDEAVPVWGNVRLDRLLREVRG